METRISFTSGRRITVRETPTQLLCNSTTKSTINSCYIECSSFSQNEGFTEPKIFDLEILKEWDSTRVDFSIGKQELFSSTALNRLHNSFIRNVH